MAANETTNTFVNDATFAGFFNESVNVTFDYVGDTNPPGRIKYLHPEGVVGKVSFVPQNNTYTGIF